MNFRRGSSFFLLSVFRIEDAERCLQKTHKLIHNLANGVGALSLESDSQSLPCSPKKPAFRFRRFLDGSYNPFPNFAFSGSLRPAYPLSAKRHVPDHIARPEYAGDGSSLPTPRPGGSGPDSVLGIPRNEVKAAGQPPRILSTEEQDKIRVVCKVPSFWEPSPPPSSLSLYNVARLLVKSWTSQLPM